MGIYKKDDVLDVEVTGVEDYGFFVNIDDSYSGLIHISEVSYNYVKDINDFVKIGDNIKAKVIEVDDEKKQLKLSIKDIDYKNEGEELKKIKETPSGFNNLSNNLEIWIAEKKEELGKDDN